MKKGILIIDDDLENCKRLKYRLQNHTTSVYYALTVADGLQAIKIHTYCLVILDTAMSDSDGFTFLTTMRQATTVPILLLSAQNSKENTLKALKLGADDFIAKPFDTEICLAKIQAFLRRYSFENHCTQPAYTLVFDQNLSIDHQHKQVTLNGNHIHLTKKEYHALFLLASNPGRIFTKDELYTYVWDSNEYHPDNSVMCLVSRLRQKLQGKDTPKNYIQTQKGFGYFFKNSL